MRFLALEIDGAFLVEAERYADERGFFQRIYDKGAFRDNGLADCSEQCSMSWNPEPATLRGLHFQRAPHAETKLVRCLSGRIFDVLVDLRSTSATYKRWQGVELSGANGSAVYVPKGCAHGFLTLEAQTLVLYQMDAPFVQHAAAGVRWDDPMFAIAWPQEPRLVGERDRNWPPVDTAAA
ncbi:MAG TPA: dTDP-4-dehydrorhamnose 3,5-epimerase [Hyphomicrobiaceae bacterium]|nr:dTDP-4-dehydrorhamnose 3,5-epimerase [Hyphomicrobiaceae bacterium]